MLQNISVLYHESFVDILLKVKKILLDLPNSFPILPKTNNFWQTNMYTDLYGQDYNIFS